MISKAILQFMCWLNTEYERLCLEYEDTDTLDDAIIHIVDNSDMLLSKTFEEAIESTYNRLMLDKYFYNLRFVRTAPFTLASFTIADNNSHEENKRDINIRSVTEYMRKHLSLIEYNIYTLYLQGQSIKNIATHEGYSETTVRNLIKTINTKLKHKYGTSFD